MALPLLLLRPQPGNDASALRAAALGLEVVQLPLFEIVPVAPAALPEGPFDALLITSANAVRCAPDVLARFAGLPAYAVGEATGHAVREAGPGAVTLGGGDAASTVPLIAQAGHRHVLHLCGEEVRAFDAGALEVTRHIVYRAQARDAAEIAPALDRLTEAVAALHSPRAGARFFALVPSSRRRHFHVAAISAAAAEACGAGWGSVSVAAAPNDRSLLACAETLCNRAG